MKPALFHITLKVFLISDNSFLVLRDKDDQHGDLPGGRLDKNEIFLSFSQAIRRELTEELGSNFRYKLRESPLFLFPHYIEKDQQEALGIAFVAELIDGNITLSEEHDQMEWVNIRSYKPETHFTDYLFKAVEHFLRIHRSLECSDQLFLDTGKSSFSENLNLDLHDLTLDQKQKQAPPALFWPFQ